MAQISDVMHALVVFDAARQELAWAYSGDFTDVPEPMKGAVHTILEVLNEAEMRWVTSTREEDPMAAAVDNKNGMAVVATRDGEKKNKREDVAVARSIGEAERKIKGWLMRLEEVACDMRAVAQKILLADYPRIHDKLSARWFSCLPRTSRATRIAPTIDTVALKLEELKKQYHEEFGHSTGLPLAATCTEQPACSSAAGGQEETETSVTGDVLVERDDDVKQRIIDIINGDRNRRHGIATILPIVGPPCVGKTTLVKSVFHEGSFGAGYKVWVDMRKGWGIKEIHESIIEVLGRHHFAGMYDGENDIISEVKNEADYGHYINQMLVLNKTQLLLVLDNLVEGQDLSMLDKLLEFLQNEGRWVIAIIITRSEAVAKYISRTVSPYRLHPCSDDMCWEIIKRTSGLDLEATAAGTYLFRDRDRGSNSEAAAVAVSEMVGREIASKCSGIPLAAKALGRFLQSVDPQEWAGLIRDVWNIGGFSSDSQQLRRLPIHSATVFTHLKRSSGVLQGAESWLSLAYCAFVFPKGKGHGVVTCDLLNQCCSLGITTRERGASCISELLDRSLLLGEKPASPASEDETEVATLLRMEDLMHDFARYHLGDRLIIVDGTNGAAPPTSSSPVNSNKSSGACLALVSNFDAKQQLDIASILPAGILALRFEGCGGLELSEVEFASAKYACLRLLDLSGCSLKKLPHSIRHLKRLRYLRAPGILQDEVFPRAITGLHELRYLILHGSRQLKDLTEAFQRLSNLLHLDLSGCIGLKALPDSFGRLWMLEHLDLSACSGIEALPESFCWLQNLSHLNLAGCSGLKALPESFGSLRRLKELDLSACSGIEALPVSFCRLRTLSHLDLSRCSGLKALPESFGDLDGLWHLDLSRCSGLKSLPESFGSLWRLNGLDLPACSGIEALPVSFCQLRTLRHLDLSCCSGLKELPESFKDLYGLRHLNLSRCSGLKALPESFGELDLSRLNLSRCSGLQVLPTSFKYFRLWHLDLSGLSRLQALPMVSLHSELRRLNLSGCSGLQELPDAPEPNELQHLDLSGCSSVRSLPSSYAKLEKLVHLNLSGCSSLISLLLLGNWTRQLEHLDLSYCSQLTDMPNNFDLPKLQYLDLSGCFRIREVPPSLVISSLVETIRSRGGRASGPQDASLRGLGTNSITTN